MSFSILRETRLAELIQDENSSKNPSSGGWSEAIDINDEAF